MPASAMNLSASTASDMKLSRGSRSPFLDGTKPDLRLAVFSDKEVTLGKYIGHGRFTESCQIRSLRRDLRYGASSIEGEKGRLQVSETVRTKGRCNYSLKQTREGLRTLREIERAVLGLTIEANYLSRLNHINIVHLVGVCHTSLTFNNEVYQYDAIITNHIAETLNQRIDYWNSQDILAKDSDFIVHLKTDYAFQIADALAYLHDRRIVFRNLTLSSIGFTPNDTIQLINFDCVKEIPRDEDYIHDGFRGNQTYAALEVYSGHPYDFKVDSFSWAICFYEMLTQEQAFASTTNEEALIREHGWSPALEDCDYIPDGLLELLEDAWETNPEERVSMKSIRDELEWILFGDESGRNDAALDFFSNTKRNKKKDQLESDMSASDYLPTPLDDVSALGLDLSGSGLLQASTQGRHRRRGSLGPINNALTFSGCHNSFLPSELLLDAKDASNLIERAASSTLQQQQEAAKALWPKLEYTEQFRGLRLEKVPRHVSHLGGRSKDDDGRISERRWPFVPSH